MQTHNPDRASNCRKSGSARVPKTNVMGKIWHYIVTWRRAPRRRPMGWMDGHLDDRLLDDSGLTGGDLLRPIRRSDLTF